MTIIPEFKLESARKADDADTLNAFREKFHFPAPGKDKIIYFTGNSLGLQPINTSEYINRELEDWKNLGVKGHAEARNPWVSYERLFQQSLANLTGSRVDEVVAMNSLTTNLHLLMASFYRPTKERYKILIDGSTFPSDRYAVNSQAKFHGFKPSEAVIEVFPPKGETYIGTDTILEAIEAEGDSIALVLISGVHYYTGELFDMGAIAEKAHKVGAVAGFDLAHAIGNVPLDLHDWQADFAVWCSYKYLNSGPGGVGGAFVHQNHHKNSELPLFAGWWGHDPETRFSMPHDFRPQKNVLAWQLSNAPVLSMAAHKASLDIFEQTDMQTVRKKSIALTKYLEQVIETTFKRHQLPYEILTPKSENARGAQLSVDAGENGKAIFKQLSENHVIADWREPSVIRMAPAPLYNSFEDVYRFGEILEKVLPRLK